jgi:hypothetical protein
MLQCWQIAHQSTRLLIASIFAYNSTICRKSTSGKGEKTSVLDTFGQFSSDPSRNSKIEDFWVRELAETFPTSYRMPRTAQPISLSIASH